MGSLRETKEEEITLVDVHGQPLQMLVQYCYTGTIELREDNVEILLATACLLQLSTVVNACCNFLVSEPAYTSQNGLRLMTSKIG